MEPIRSFNVDFNWINNTYSPGDAFAEADPAKLAEWYQEMGCNNFWTFAVSYNGYAWYDSKLSPKIEGLKGNFTKACVEEGHKRGMSVFAYHCLAANPVIEAAHPEWSRKDSKDLFPLIFCDDYLDWFCKAIQESITMCDYDGLVIDWFRCPQHRLEEWAPEEKKLYEQLMGCQFPKRWNPFAAQIVKFEKLSIEHAWDRIKAAVKEVRDIPIWTNHPFDFIENPVWIGNRLLKEVDYVLNECPDYTLLDWLRKEAGPNTHVVQNLCGWNDHDLTCLTEDFVRNTDMFGFAAANPQTCMPFENELDALDETALAGKTRKFLEDTRRNIRDIRRMYQSVLK